MCRPPKMRRPSTRQSARPNKSQVHIQPDHLTEAAPALQARSFAVGFAFGFYSGAVFALILWGLCR
jgi:hypothetical protein